MKVRYLSAAAAISAALALATPNLALAQEPAAASQEQNLVARAQTALAEQGFYRGDVTGAMDRRTERAIKRFQNSNFLVESGTLTPETLRRLFRE